MVAAAVLARAFSVNRGRREPTFMLGTLILGWTRCAAAYLPGGCQILTRVLAVDQSMN